MKNNLTNPNEPIMTNNPNYDGLTKREYFAAMILQGFCSFPIDKTDPDIINEGNAFSVRAKAAVRQADALILELNKPTEQK